MNLTSVWLAIRFDSIDAPPNGCSEALNEERNVNFGRGPGTAAGHDTYDRGCGDDVQLGRERESQRDCDVNYSVAIAAAGDDVAV